MRTVIYILITIFFSFSSHSKEKLFQKPIEVNLLPIEYRVSHTFNYAYKETKYYQQNSFNLFQDLEIKLSNGHYVNALFLKSITYSMGSYSSIYKISNEPNALLVFSEYKGKITGIYTSQLNEKFIFQNTAVNIFAISQVDEAYYSNFELSEFNDFDSFSSNDYIHNDICIPESQICPDNTRIDVMILFSNNVSFEMGSEEVAISYFSTAVTNLNISMENSNIQNVNFNLVFSTAINYPETGDAATDLNRLRIPDDGFLDEVHELRNIYGADLVSLVLDQIGSICGRGNLNDNSTQYDNSLAFSVVRLSCAVGSLTLSHEFGHNMGLLHDWYVNQSNLPCNHHHGYSNTTAILYGVDSDYSQRWRTIMAYNNECEASNIFCSRINYWSNPEVYYNGEKTGVEIGEIKPSNEAFGFRRFGCIVSEFMPEALDVKDFSNRKWIIFPNPVSNIFSISGVLDIKEVKVFNKLNQLILRFSNNQIYDISNLNSGIYNVYIYGFEDKIVEIKKIIKY